MYISFKKDAWDEGAVTHAYTYRFPFTNRFIQMDGYIENAINAEMPDGFDYLSLLSREKYPLGTKITVNCSFSGNAAPLFVVAESLDLCEDGAYRYGNFFEIVLYKNGINVWRMWREENGDVAWHKRLSARFPVTENQLHKVSVSLDKGYITVSIDDMLFSLRADDLFESFHLGITGCEGPCRFYDMEIEKTH